MKELLLTAGEIWENYIWAPISRMTFVDWLDIFILTAVLYGLFMFIKGRRAGKLALGFGLLLLIFVFSGIVGLRAVHALLQGVAPFTVLLLAVVFQPELRDALEKLGSTPLGLFAADSRARADVTNTVNCVVEAACQVALSPTDGAIIVIEGTTPLGDYVTTGQSLDAEVSTPILRNIFIEGAPLHDGAVLIRNNRLAAAGCKLPLSDNEEVVKGMGTRHRAAVGLSEVSDCVVVVVSEERHTISIANNGLIKRDYNKGTEDILNEEKVKNLQNTLRKDLFRMLTGVSQDEEERANERRRFWTKIKFRWGFGGEKDASEKDARGKGKGSSKSAGAPVYKAIKTVRKDRGRSSGEKADEITDPPVTNKTAEPSTDSTGGSEH